MEGMVNYEFIDEETMKPLVQDKAMFPRFIFSIFTKIHKLGNSDKTVVSSCESLKEGIHKIAHYHCSIYSQGGLGGGLEQLDLRSRKWH